MDDNKRKDINDRIDYLYGNSDKQIAKNEMPIEEKKIIRKKMLLLLFFTTITMVIIVFIFFNPFEQKKNYNSNTSNIESKDELMLGEIDITNKIVQQLNERIKLSVLDLYYIDTFDFFKNKTITSNELTDDLKIHLIEKNDLFFELLIDIGVFDYVETCDESGLIIPKDRFDEVVKKTLGNDITIQEEISKTLHYKNISKNSNLLLVKTGDNILVNCQGETLINDLTKYPYQLLTNAVVIEEGIELYYKVVFIDDDKVYKDYELTKLITELKGSNNNDYVKDGSVYKYTFIKSDKNNYYLSKIEMIE